MALWLRGLIVLDLTVDRTISRVRDGRSLHGQGGTLNRRVVLEVDGIIGVGVGPIVDHPLLRGVRQE